MREYYRPFTKIVTISDQDKVTVVFDDTASNPIECNYITVTSVSGGADGYFQVLPVGPNGLGIAAAAQVAASGMTSNSASGICGMVGNTENGSVAISLALFDGASSLLLSQNNDTATMYAISYGVINLANPRADDSLAKTPGS